MQKGYSLAYLILGLGIGIVLTSFIYILNPNFEYKEYSEDKIIAEAIDLGMVFLKDNASVQVNEDIPIKSKQSIEFVIESGDTLEKVSDRLEELKIIESSREFQQFIRKKGVEKKLQVGVYRLSTDLDYTAILNIITGISYE